MRKSLTAGALACATALAAAAPAQAKVVLADFSLSPACVQPGGDVTADAALYNDDPLRVEPVHARVTVRTPVTGIVLHQSDQPRVDVPFGWFSSTSTAGVPAYTPTGNYNVTLQLGSTQGGSQWGSQTRLLKVRRVAQFCSF